MENVIELLSGELGIACAVTLLSLSAVWIPFRRGFKVYLHARAATRPLRPEQIRACLEGTLRYRVEPLCVLMARVYQRSRAESQGRHPSEFLRDAAKQYVLNEYDATYTQTLSMYANLLPPIGFIGTLIGLLVLFVSMHLNDESLKLGALAVALTSTIFALIGLAILEGLKIRLHRRLLRCLAWPEAGEAAPDAPASGRKARAPAAG